LTPSERAATSLCWHRDGCRPPMLVRGSLAVHLHQQGCPRARPSPALLATRPLAGVPPGRAHTRRRLPPRRQRTTVPGVQRPPGAVLILVLLHRLSEQCSSSVGVADRCGSEKLTRPVMEYPVLDGHSPPQRIDRSNGELLPSRRGRTGLTARLTLRCGFGTQWWGAVGSSMPMAAAPAAEHREGGSVPGSDRAAAVITAVPSGPEWPGRAAASPITRDVACHSSRRHVTGHGRSSAAA